MAYTAWSVVAGETPTASKWNLLGSNDASFNDGTGIGTNAIQAPSLAASAITLGYAEITSNFSSAVGGGTAADVAGLSVTFTVPSGGRRVEAIAWSRLCASSQTAGNGVDVYLTDSSNVVKSTASFTTPVTNYAEQAVPIYSAVLAAGTYTYKVRMSQGGTGTMQMQAGATYPAFLLIKLI